MAQESTIVIDKFLGLHLDSTDGLNIQTGELSECTNCLITENYKLRKRPGYVALFPTALAKQINGIWYGRIANVYRFVFSCNGYVYSRDSISTTDYDSLDTSSYTHVDVVKTTAYASAVAGTTGVDNKTIVVNSSGTQMTEVAQANIDLVASVGKYYYHTDKTVWLIVAKGAYASIAAARTGLGTTTAWYHIGTCADASTSFFAFNDKLYLQDGTNYKYWNGSSNVATVDGYIPKIAVATPYGGGGTDYEGINLLTGKKHQTFNGDGSHDTFQLRELAVDSVDSVYVGGVLKTVTTHYTVNATNGTVTFTGGNIPASGTDNVDIYWTKGSGTRTEVTAHKRSILFGGANDSRVFMWGDGNTVIFSSLANGIPSAEYFEASNYLTVGSDEYAVNHLSKQYDRLIINKEADSYYATYEYDVTNGTSFPTYPLNDSVGQSVFGQGQTILNNPFVISGNKVFQFTATNVRDEKNAVLTSQRVQDGLDSLDLSTAITFDFQEKLEYWISVGNKVYVYNYKNDTWYYYELAHAPTCFYEIDGEAYFGTSTGLVMRFNDDLLTDNGTKISARAELGFLDFGANYLRKFLTFGWVGLQAEGASYAKLTWETDVDASASDFEILHKLIDFSNIDFSDFSFETNYTPRPFRLKMKAKKFTYFKLIIENDETTYKMTILNVTLPALLGGMSKLG